MSFSFGFFGGDGSARGTDSGSSNNTTNATTSNQPCLTPLKKHFPLEMFDQGGDLVYTPMTYGAYVFNKVDIEENENAIDKKSDIIPGVYEGGNKVWECSVDLATFLLQNKPELVMSSNPRVIELGCGHAFPGIAALKIGYHSVVFSDLNSNVIDSATWPNIYLNCKDAMAQVACYSGDWELLSEHLFNRYETVIIIDVTIFIEIYYIACVHGCFL